MTRRCCGQCKSLVGLCGLQWRRQCHQEASEARTARLAREFVDEALAAHHRPIPRHTEAAIIAAQIGVDGPMEVARRHKVSVGAVRDLWRTAEKGD